MADWLERVASKSSAYSSPDMASSTKTPAPDLSILAPAGFDPDSPTDRSPSASLAPADVRSLRRVPDRLPPLAYVIGIIELCERFTFYGASGLFQNYGRASSHSPTGTGPVGLGLDRYSATGLNTFFQFFCYVTSIFGAIAGDQFLGRYKTVVISACIYLVGLIVLWTTALDVSIAAGAGLPGFITSIIIIGIGSGGIKANVAPLVAGQYQHRDEFVKLLPSGERVIVDPHVTYQRIYTFFYGCIEVGTLSLLATPFLERDVGFWAAFLLPFAGFIVGLILIVLPPALGKPFKSPPPRPGVITNALRASFLMLIARRYDAAKPSWRIAHGKSSPVPWDDHFVDELSATLSACKIFVVYPVIWVCFAQLSSNLVTQAGQMQGHGLPNDLMQSFHTIFIIALVPLFEFVIYPGLRRRGYLFRPIARIATGAGLVGLSMAYAAITQKLIYDAGPCYAKPAACPAGKGMPNNIHIAIQTPSYFILAFGSILLNATGVEYAYTKSAPSIRSFVQSLYLLTVAVGVALATALVPVSSDPSVLWMYTSLAVVCVIEGVLFYVAFRSLDTY